MWKQQKNVTKPILSAKDLKPKSARIAVKTTLSASVPTIKPAVPKPENPYFAKDSLVNVLTGMGTSKDSRTANNWQRSIFDPDMLDTIYSEHWLARNCVDIPANDVVARWRTVKASQLTPDQIKLFHKFEKATRLRKKIQEALRLARKYGGAAIFLAVNGQKLEEPLNAQGVKPGSEINLIVFDRTELGIREGILENDEFSGAYGEPNFLTILRSGKRVHRSRFIVFRGPVVFDSRAVGYDNRFWGGSILDSSLVASIERCESALDSLTKSLEGATIDVLKIPGLFQRLADPEATRLLRARVSEGSMTKSIYKISISDKDEEFQRAEATGSLSSGAQVVQLLMQVPSGATSIPVTKLLGISPGGLNATGESDSENYYGLLNSIRENDIDPELETVDSVFCQILFGRIFDDWEYDWESFWSVDKVEESTVESNRINGIMTLVNGGVLPEQVALRQIYEDGIYSALTEADIKAFEEFVNEKDEDDNDLDSDMGDNPDNPDSEDEQAGEEQPATESDEIEE